MSNTCKKWINEVKLLPKLTFCNIYIRKQDYGMEKFVFDVKYKKKEFMYVTKFIQRVTIKF
jgi:hypothetical protein